MIGIGLGLPKRRRRSEAHDDLSFITYTYPKAHHVYFKSCISAHLGVAYDIDLTAQANMVYFGSCASGTREVSDGFYGS